MLATPTNETGVAAVGRAQALAGPLDAYTRGCAMLATYAIVAMSGLSGSASP